jgi:hypothetical protein
MKVAAALLLAFISSAAILPLASSGARRHGCHCPVRMACCENGTCTMSGAEPPATGPEWRTCRREAPASAATLLDAFERAVRKDFLERRERESGARVADLLVARLRSDAPGPATPPPRVFSF